MGHALGSPRNAVRYLSVCIQSFRDDDGTIWPLSEVQTQMSQAQLGPALVNKDTECCQAAGSPILLMLGSPDKCLGAFWHHLEVGASYGITNMGLSLTHLKVT